MSNVLNKTQVAKAMKAAGIEGELTGRGMAWEVELADEKTMRAFCKKVIPAGGFRTGYASWILRPGYTLDPFDYNSTAARCHY
jgi:hypothetical protein